MNNGLPSPNEVQTGQVREYMLSNGFLFGTFRVGERSEDGPFWAVEWLAGVNAGKSSRLHEGTIKQCAEVE